MGSEMCIRDSYVYGYPYQYPGVTICQRCRSVFNRVPSQLYRAYSLGNYRTDVFRIACCGIISLPNTPVLFETNSIPVPDTLIRFGTLSIPVPNTSLISVGLQHVYPTVWYVRDVLHIGTRQFGKGVLCVFYVPTWYGTTSTRYQTLQ